MILYNLTIFDETKPARQWGMDERCAVKKSMFYNRLKNGMSPEEAFTIPAKKQESLEFKIKRLGDKKDRYESWIKDNPDATREQKRKRAEFLLNEERCRKSSVKYRVNNKDKKNAYQNKWRKDNPENRRFHEMNRERRIHDTPKELMPSNAELLAWKEIYGNDCCYCGSTENLTLEHLDPISKGGTHTLDNLLWACRSCNCSKKDDTLIFWLWKKCKKDIYIN